MLELLLPPHGFEGLFRLEECSEAGHLCVTEADHVARRELGLNSAASASVVDLPNKDCDVPYRQRILHFEADEVPRIVHIPQRTPQSGATPVHAILSEACKSRAPLDLGIAQLDESVEVALFHSVDHPPGDLHVLLRHRLLLEAEVGEGAGAVPVKDEPGHPAVTELEQICYGVLAHLQATGST